MQVTRPTQSQASEHSSMEGYKANKSTALTKELSTDNRKLLGEEVPVFFKVWPIMGGPSSFEWPYTKYVFYILPQHMDKIL